MTARRTFSQTSCDFRAILSKSVLSAPYSPPASSLAFLPRPFIRLYPQMPFLALNSTSLLPRSIIHLHLMLDLVFCHHFVGHIFPNFPSCFHSFCKLFLCTLHSLPLLAGLQRFRPHCMCLTRLESLFQVLQPEHSKVLIYHPWWEREDGRSAEKTFAGLVVVNRAARSHLQHLSGTIVWGLKCVKFNDSLQTENTTGDCTSTSISNKHAEIPFHRYLKYFIAVL